MIEIFELRGATVERREQLPAAPPPGPLRLGAQVDSVAAARERLGFEPLVPVAAGPPDAVYVRDDIPGGELSLVYGRQPGLLVTEFRGDLVPEYLGKIAGAATRVERLSVDGERAIWIAGAPHFFFYRPPGGEFAERRLRLARERSAARARRPAGAPRGLLRSRAGARARAVAQAFWAARLSGTAYQSTANMKATAAVTIATVVFL